jgi:uncharacterized membrane protein
MKIDRSLVKSQANQIIKKQVFKLFLISFVVSILVSGSSAISSYKTIFDNSNDYNTDYNYNYYYNYGDDDYSSAYGNQNNKNYFDSFSGKIALQTASVKNLASTKLSYINFNTLGIVELVFLPLTVTLEGMYVLLVRGKKFSLGDEFSFVFGNVFDKNYFKKWLVVFLKGIIIVVMTCLLIVPGIIFGLKYYFAEMVMMDNPDLSATDAIKISRKITKGHRGEIFSLVLSFIGWFLLTIITFGIASIYVTPYYQTTKALYYENFRIRAFQEGAVTAVDFMSDDEKAVHYQEQYCDTTNTGNYYQPPQDTYGSGMDNDYYNGNI